MDAPNSQISDRTARVNAPRQFDEMETPEERFLTSFESVLVESPAPILFQGSVARTVMLQFWRWISRDIAPELSQQLSACKNDEIDRLLDAALPNIIKDIRQQQREAQTRVDGDRKFVAQMGGEEVFERLEIILGILRCRPLLAKAVAFGRNSDAIRSDSDLGTALQGLPLGNAAAAAILFHALVGNSNNPVRLISSVLEKVGSSKEAALERAGFAPLIEAFLAHAQNQISQIEAQKGVFSDVDLICHGVSRFHRLLRASTGYLELEPSGRWARIARDLTRRMGTQIEPRLREVSADVSQSLRKSRESADVVDTDRLLAGLNGMYLLAAVRDAKESMALNALFEKIWIETGQSLEILVNRNLELYKTDPSDQNAEKRLDMGIKMAEIRFNTEYAEILARAKQSAGRRSA